MGIGTYILDGHDPVLCEDTITWGRWMEQADRHVAETKIGDANVSTVFLGLDHNFEQDGLPVVFETMVFGGKFDGEQKRYSTWEDAEKGHEKTVKMVEEGKWRITKWAKFWSMIEHVNMWRGQR